MRDTIHNSSTTRTDDTNDATRDSIQLWVQADRIYSMGAGGSLKMVRRAGRGVGLKCKETQAQL